MLNLRVFIEYIVIHTVPSENKKHKSVPETVSGPDSLQMLTAYYHQKEIQMAERAKRDMEKTEQKESGRLSHTHYDWSMVGLYTVYINPKRQRVLQSM